jgi:hypothetical protein
MLCWVRFYELGQGQPRVEQTHLPTKRGSQSGVDGPALAVLGTRDCSEAAKEAQWQCHAERRRPEASLLCKEAEVAAATMITMLVSVARWVSICRASSRCPFHRSRRTSVSSAMGILPEASKAQQAEAAKRACRLTPYNCLAPAQDCVQGLVLGSQGCGAASDAATVRRQPPRQPLDRLPLGRQSVVPSTAPCVG